jgi:hypothetical protein
MVDQFPAFAMSPIDLSGSVTLQILIQRVCVTCVLAPRCATISPLKSLLLNPDANLIFNGILLSDENTVEFYRLHINHWMMATREAGAFSDSINSIPTPDSRNEMARLRDQVTIRCEVRPRMGRRFVHQKPSDGNLSGVRTQQ